MTCYKDFFTKCVRHLLIPNLGYRNAIESTCGVSLLVESQNHFFSVLDIIGSFGGRDGVGVG